MRKWSVGLPSIPVFPPRTDYRQPVDQTQGLLFQDGLGDHQGIRRRRIVWDIIQRQTSCTEFPDQRRISEEIRFSRLLGYFPSGKVNARTDPFPVRYEGQRHWHLLSSTASKTLVHDHQHAQFARFQQASGQFSLQGLVIDVTQSASHPQGDQSAFTLRQEGDSCSLGQLSSSHAVAAASSMGENTRVGVPKNGSIVGATLNRLRRVMFRRGVKPGHGRLFQRAVKLTQDTIAFTNAVPFSTRKPSQISPTA